MGLWGRWSTYLEQSSCNYSGNQNPSCFQKTVETVLDRVLDIALTVNVLVKHPRSGLPPTVLYNLSYLQLQLQLLWPPDFYFFNSITLFYNKPNEHSRA